jgi:flagellar assembly factor FliW
MQIDTTRFGKIEIEPDHLLHFPAGMLGLEDCRHWVLLADVENEGLGWLQCTSRAEIALAVVSPRRYVPEYQVRISRGELAALELTELRDAHLLAILGNNESGITLNLKAPVVINLQRRLGRQVITNGELPIQYPLSGSSERATLRKSA